MGKKKLTEDNFWAQHIIRAQQDGEDCIFALVRRKYADDDIESTGPGEYLGLDRTESFAKINDTDPDSETFGQRIDKPNSEPIGVRMIFKDKFTPANIKKYQKMCGVTSFGQTEYIYKFRQINIAADKVDEFWTIKQDDAYNRYVLKDTVVNIEENKPNSRRKNP
jgi:hypothetical protein